MSATKAAPDPISASSPPLNLARDCTATVGNASNAAWQAALNAGWSEEQPTELSAHVTPNLLTNYFNHHVHTDLAARDGRARLAG